MANYYCSARSNYFRVKNGEAFRTWAQKRGLEINPHETLHGLFAISPGDSTDSGAFPTYDDEKDTEIDFEAELATHLTNGSIAVLLETGAEKLRYLQGYAVAINARGARVDLSLDEIYHRAKKRFPKAEITRAEY